MNRTHRARLVLVALIGTIVCGCAGRGGAASPSSVVPAEYAALPDTLVCVVDRSTPLGLRELPAKVGASGVVVLADGEVRPLEDAHPVSVIAGYAGREPWLTQGDPLLLEGQNYARTGGERRIPADLLRREGEYQGILVFGGEDDPTPPQAVYVPTAPGCIFQAYVREDLLPR